MLDMLLYCVLLYVGYPVVFHSHTKPKAQSDKSEYITHMGFLGLHVHLALLRTLTVYIPLHTLGPENSGFTHKLTVDLTVEIQIIYQYEHMLHN